MTVLALRSAATYKHIIALKGEAHIVAEAAQCTVFLRATPNGLPPTFKPHHFESDMLRFDIGLIVRKAQEKDLGDDALVDRLKRAFRYDDAPARMAGTLSPSPTKA